MASSYVFFAVYLSSFYLGAYSQQPRGTCNGTQFPTVCSSCRTLILCASNTTSTCPNNQVCQESGNLASCTDSNPVCQCPTQTGTSNRCDPFNNLISIGCVDGVINGVQDCSLTDMECNAETGVCDAPFTGTTVTNPPPVTDTTCAAGQSTPTKRNCTAFYLCEPGELPNDHSCSDDQIFSNTVGDCIDYRPFSCALDAPGNSGLFADPFNCTVYHICQGGSETLLRCPDDSYFDESTFGCEVNNGECTDETCVPCKSSSDIFPVNTTACISTYNQCISNPNDDPATTDDDLTFTTQSCPDGFVFDPSTNFCTRNCSLFRKKRLARY